MPLKVKLPSVRRLIPAGNLLAFVSFHYLLVLGHVPAANQVPATLGSTSFTAMTLAMFLAARFPVVDQLLDGPGRSYRLHRWLGYLTIVPMIGHWILATPLGSGMVPELASSAAVSAKYASILLIMLVVISPLKLIPYHLWKYAHYLMGPIYLIAVYHTFFSKIPLKVGDMVWFVLLALSVVGIASLFWIMVRHIKAHKTYFVSNITRIKEGLDIRIKPLQESDRIKWVPGQFATVSLEWGGSREKHPYTISSAPGKGEMRFVIGNRGDYTLDMMWDLKLGDKFRIHEVSGEFMPDFAPDRPKQQVWVAGGIGVTPFLAAIDAMVPDEGPSIDLVYCYRSLLWAFDAERLAMATKTLPQLRVHFFDGEQAGFFHEGTLPDLCAPGWQQGDLYVCGPEPLIDLACDSWRHHGGQGAIHVELFEFRTSWNGSTFLGKKRPNIHTDAKVPQGAIKSFRGNAEFAPKSAAASRIDQQSSVQKIMAESRKRVRTSVVNR